MVVDDEDTWLGTSNWGGDYFYKSRNVGVIAHGKTINDELTRSFNHYWDSSYVIKVDPNRDYPVKNQAKPSHYSACYFFRSFCGLQPLQLAWAGLWALPIRPPFNRFVSINKE